MTNREHMIALLQSPYDEEAVRYFNREFGCSRIPIEECIKHDNCYECWTHWLESEVSTNDHT